MPEWSNFAGFQAVVAWQLSHSARVTMWLAPWPVAMVPSWHEVQLPSTLPWSMRVTGFHATVAWQASQAVVALMCRAPTPVALVPSWQAAQRSVTPAWSKRAGSQAEVA